MTTTSARRGDTVLVVEDNRRVRQSCVDVLTLAGFHVVEASNGFQALRALENGLRPAVILLDLELPLMSGWHLRRALQADSVLARIPVVLATAHDVGKTPGPGVHSILQKPFAGSALFDAVQACIEHRAT